MQSTVWNTQRGMGGWVSDAWEWRRGPLQDGTTQQRRVAPAKGQGPPVSGGRARAGMRKATLGNKPPNTSLLPHTTHTHIHTHHVVHMGGPGGKPASVAAQGLWVPCRVLNFSCRSTVRRSGPRPRLAGPGPADCSFRELGRGTSCQKKVRNKL